MARTDVVIVEDDADLRAAVVEVLAREGIKAWETSDLDAAEEAVRTLLPAVLVLDLMLKTGGVDANALMHRIRRADPRRFLPVILMSGMSNLNRHAMRLGAVAVLEKPFRSQELVGAVQPWCRKGPKRASDALVSAQPHQTEKVARVA